jgi:hypothetical protein
LIFLIASLSSLRDTALAIPSIRPPESNAFRAATAQVRERPG